MNLARVLMHAVVVRRELLSSRHPSNIPPFCKIGGQNRKIQCALINQGFSQKATSKTLKILTFLCLFSSPERRSIRRCTEFHLKLKIHRWRQRTGSSPVTGTRSSVLNQPESWVRTLDFFLPFCTSLICMSRNCPALFCYASL